VGLCGSEAAHSEEAGDTHDEGGDETHGTRRGRTSKRHEGAEGNCLREFVRCRVCLTNCTHLNVDHMVTIVNSEVTISITTIRSQSPGEERLNFDAGNTEFSNVPSLDALV